MTTTGKSVVLLVDDQDQLRALLSRALQGAGYLVLEAASGEDALGLLPKHRSGIDVLVTDVMMPGIDGVQLAERVQEEVPRTKVLFISGCAGNLLRPGVPFLQKPFEVKTFLQYVAKLAEPAAAARIA